MKVLIFSQLNFDYISLESKGRWKGQPATWLPQLIDSYQNVLDLEIHWVSLHHGHGQTNTSSIFYKNQYFHKLYSPKMTIGFVLNMFFEKKVFKKLIKKIKPDIIHCWGTESFNPAALRVFRGPSVLSMQGIITTYRKTGDLPGWRWSKFAKWEPESIRLARIVTSESEWGINQVRKIHPKVDIRRVEYGVSESFYSVKWAPNPNNLQVLFAGSFTRLKGVDTLIDLAKKFPNRSWTLAFAGDGYLHDELKTLESCGIKVLGKLSFEQLQFEMSRSIALVIPSRADTSPNVVKEARVIGLPVVASDTGGQAGYVEDGIDGLIVNVRTPDQWFEAIDSIASDYQNALKMGGINHEQYREYFKPVHTAEGFVKIYRELAGR